MIDPIRDRQLSELNLVEVCVEILRRARNELYLNMRFLDVALSSLEFEADWAFPGVGTDGFRLVYHPEYLAERFQAGRVLVNRAYLHMVFHCLFGHVGACRPGKEDLEEARESRLWDLACDVAMESILDGLYQKCVYIHPSAGRREFYLRLKSGGLKVFTAEGVYRALGAMDLEERDLARLEREFFVDDHSLWSRPQPPARARERQNRWKDNREKVQTAMETGSKEQSEDYRDLLEQVRAENRERYDYRDFLRRFSVLREEIGVDVDSFDYGLYAYGMELYGNMPLLEPLETREARRIEDFVIVVDTSMSCSGDLVRRFLEETYGVLAEAESYFRKINVHIIQCDDQVQSDAVIRSQEEMRAYLEAFSVKGHGGTDFRPAFEYVRGLRAEGRFSELRGLLYFTDGKGIYPVESPPYTTAFVFIEDHFTDVSVPPWAMKLILTGEDLPGAGQMKEGRGPGTVGAEDERKETEPGMAAWREDGINGY